MNALDTIAAFATPPGRGGIGILRISGYLVVAVGKALLGRLPRARQAEYLPFLDKDRKIIDQGIALFFPAPHSFTGEDVLELQAHGGPVILDLLLQHVLTVQGVRVARPGEFSERAFLNNKLDLVQAEAIADLIDASSIQAARAAFRSLQGTFSSRIHELVKKLTDLRIYIEAAINFPDEGISFFSDSNIELSLNQIIVSLDMVCIEARRGSLLRSGMKVVIAGQPNVGKSTLLNALAGREVAIVTSSAGTTRDILSEHIHLDGIPICIIDTAGLRDPTDEVENIGIERARREIEHADHVLLVVDGKTTGISGDPKMLCPEFKTYFPEGVPLTVIRNKADLTGEMAGIIEEREYTLITLSAHFGCGVDILREHLKKIMGFFNNSESVFLARRRHLDALKTAAYYLEQGRERFMKSDYGELLAEDLCLAQEALSEITGGFRSDELLSRIFSSFCVGK